MPDPKLEQLIEDWEDRRQEGREVSAEELCRDCPELVNELKQRITLLKSMDWLLESNPSTDGGHGVADAAWQELPRTLGRYRLDELVGTGGFGQVWKGFDPELQRTVAIKVPRPDRIASPDQADKFVEEARKVAQLRHPGIVPVHDVGRDGNWYFIVSDFIDGGSLAQRILGERPGWKESAQLVAGVAEILQYAHQQGFIHRDIKPANILLDTQGKPYLTDFGIAISNEKGLQSGTGTEGTLAYMSPEQVAGGTIGIDCRSDLYGLGVVLYELLTGQRPFVADNPIDLRNAILSDQPRPPKVFDETVPLELERICLKALAKEPEARHSTAAELAASLRVVAAARRRRWPIWAGAGVVLVGIAVAFASGRWQTDQEQAKVIAKGRNAADQAHAELRNLTTQARIDLPGDKSDPTATTKPDFKQAGRSRLLGSVKAAGTPTADADLEHLRSNLMLQTLDLSHTKITDAGLQHIKDLPLLQHLNLADTSISDEGLGQIRPLHLRTLDLSGTKISDAGLEHLCDRHGIGGSLTTLNLERTVVTDAAIQHIRTLSRLKELRIANTKITTNGIEELQAALPGCEIR